MTSHFTGKMSTVAAIGAISILLLAQAPLQSSESAQGDPPPQLRLVDQSGHPLAGLTLTVLRDSGGGKVISDELGRVPLAVARRDKLTLSASGPAGRYTTRSFVIPEEASGLIDVTLVPAGAGGTVPNNPTPIQVGETLSGNTAIDGVRVTDPTCGGPMTAPGLWFAVEGTGETLTASTCSQADYDTQISVFCGLTNCGVFTGPCVDSNDDAPGCEGFTSEVSWCAELGTSALILVHGFGEEAGAFDLTLSGSGDDCRVGTGQSCYGPPPRGVCCTCLDSPFNCSVGGDCFGMGGDIVAFFPCADCSPVFNFSNPLLTIPDDGFPELVSDSVYVSGGVIEDINVKVRTDHGWIGDLHHIIESPSGTQVTLWQGNCDDGPFGRLNAEFDDDGTAQSCNPDGATPAPDDGNGRIRPQGGVPLSVFNGSSAEGTWTLHSSDDFPGDQGTLRSWWVRINNEAPRTVCDPPDTPGSATGEFTICHCLPNGPCQTRTLPSHVANRHLLNHGADSLGACE